MAKVRATQMRLVYQYKDAAGHRLPSQKEVWKNTWGMMADCPKCPEPEPEQVECMSSWHRQRLVDLQNSSVKYCPQCGKRLREG